MAAESPRKHIKFVNNVIRPQPFSDKTVMENVVDFISDVVPQAYTGSQKVDDKEKIQWIRFEKSDINDISRNPDFTVGENKGIPLLLILGYSNGVQIWNVMPNGEAQEVYSVRQGPVRILRVLPSPTPVFGENDIFANKRPLVALCDTSSAGQPYCAVKFVSLKTGDEVHNVSFKNYQVVNIESNKRVVVVVFKEKLCVFDAATLKQKFWITDCFPSPGPTENPIALGSRWLAYADKRLVPLHQSCGGMSGDGSQSYAATVISAAKGAFKGLSVFSEAVVSNLTGNKPSSTPKSSPQMDNGNRPGIVSIVDLQNIHGDHYCVSEDGDDDSLVAHFHAHANEPISHMVFDPAGTLLLTACKLGHNFHVFRIMAHPCSSSLGAVHHLYTLHRGDTTAKVIDMAFSQDSRWVTVSTHRGTTHVFPVTPYGGNINVRTHCKARVVNRASRFHKSAGIDDMDRAGRQSPILSGSPGSSSGNYDNYPSMIRQNALNNNLENPRLPPYPHATQTYPMAQIKQPLILATGLGGKTQSPTHTSPGGKDNVMVVNACFSTPRLWIGGNPNVSVEHREGKRVVDSLFVMSQTGVLSEYILEPRAKSGVDKVSGDSPLELVVTGYTQWNLQRPKASEEIKPPLTNNNPLLLSCEAVLTQQPSALCDEISAVPRYDSKESLSSDVGGKDMDIEEQWLSQVEMITHIGPHRRLWMGPQFSFKTYQNVQNTTVLSAQSSSLLSPDPQAMDITIDDVNLESLKIQPNRSSPVAMPNARPAYRRLSGSDSTPPTGKSGQNISPLLIEAGSFDQSPNLCDVYSSWAESPLTKPRSSEEDDDRIKETLAEAMLESPAKECGPSSMISEVFDGSNENLSTSSSSSTSVSMPRNAEHILDNVFSTGSQDSSG